MQVFSIEPAAFTARMSARDKVNFQLSANSLAQRSPPPQSYRVVDGVAVINITGLMLTSPDPLDLFLGGFTNTRGVTQQVELASVDTSVQAIILRVDSPGGSVDGLAELGDAVRAAARRKPTIGQVEGMGASAAYYAIASASEIVSERMALIGSVGTVLVICDASEAAKSAGLRVVPITTGKYKATGTFGTPLTGDEEEYLRNIVDEYFADFRRTVMSGRGTRLSLADWSEVSTGKVFVASDALKLGLIDRFGRMGDTVAALARLAADFQRTRARVQRLTLAVGEMDAPRRVVDRAAKQRATLQRAELQTARR
jgi:signal peptide peptidase SppA